MSEQEQERLDAVAALIKETIDYLDAHKANGDTAIAPAHGGEWQEPDDPTVTFAEFVGREDDAATEPLIAIEQGIALPAGGLVILAAKTGDGKTTATVELILHASAGLDYLGFSFPRPLRILVIQNEGPRDAFRMKLEARLANWEHGGEPRIWDVPQEWGMIRLSNPSIRERLRRAVEEHRIDLIVSDSLTRFGVRGNGTPEETRDFVELMTEVGLGRDVAFMLLAHPRTRSDPGEDELERIAGAWPPHADLILLLKKLDSNRARLSYPKIRWTHGQKPPSILAFDPATESFTYVGDDVPVERDYPAEVEALMKAKPDQEWWTVTDLRASKTKGGIGARAEAVEQAVTDERFESAQGESIGRTKGHAYYRLTNVTQRPEEPVTLQRSLLEEARTSPSPPIERAVGGDVAVERHDARYVARDANPFLEEDS